MLDMAKTREVFDASRDFTVGIEEEFAILDPDTMELTQRFEELQAAAAEDDLLSVAVAGELISSEIEIRSKPGDDLADALDSQREHRRRLFALAASRGLLLGSTGTHPWSRWQDQHIIDTEHYQRLNDDLGYVAWRNNTFSLHVHVGIRGADRAIAVCDRMRAILPELLAISANSPFLDGRDSGLASARTQIFTRSFPRCGIPEAFGSFQAYADYVNFLVEMGSVIEFTQLWWSVRPHHRYGTVEIRISDAQTRAADSDAMAGLMVACAAQAAIDYDEGVPVVMPEGRLIEENTWRAIRYGLEGRMIDLDERREFPAAALPDRLLAWTAPARSQLGIEPAVPRENGTTRQRGAVSGGATIAQVYAAEVAETQQSFAGDQTEEDR
ncbi:MAG: glutamate---cysteine ligase / carboxylate-amine ligase [Thermoleophilaceae bacterium]|jgi:carboxylate-amine ligase|nr:glutamate---cysteine ligase / carboxylate-amine ligase [Thermoleophilaceae bacterium]